MGVIAALPPRSLAAAAGTRIDDGLPPQNEPEEEEPQCPGDLDGNGTIGSPDLAIVLGSYGKCYRCEADLTGDGYVDRKDIDELMASWGDCAEQSLTDMSPKGRSRPESLTQG